MSVIQKPTDESSLISRILEIIPITTDTSNLSTKSSNLSTKSSNLSTKSSNLSTKSSIFTDALATYTPELLSNIPSTNYGDNGTQWQMKYYKYKSLYLEKN